MENNKTFFPDKGLNCNKIISDNDQIISDEATIADTMNKHFDGINKKLKLNQQKLKQMNLHCQKD